MVVGVGNEAENEEGIECNVWVGNEHDVEGYVWEAAEMGIERYVLEVGTEVGTDVGTAEGGNRLDVGSVVCEGNGQDMELGGMAAQQCLRSEGIVYQ